MEPFAAVPPTPATPFATPLALDGKGDKFGGPGVNAALGAELTTPAG